jgi:hypothetical protein
LNDKIPAGLRTMPQKGKGHMEDLSIQAPQGANLLFVTVTNDRRIVRLALDSKPFREYITKPTFIGQLEDAYRGLGRR